MKSVNIISKRQAFKSSLNEFINSLLLHPHPHPGTCLFVTAHLFIHKLSSFPRPIFFLPFSLSMPEASLVNLFSWAVDLLFLLQSMLFHCKDVIASTSLSVWVIGPICSGYIPFCSDRV